MLLGVSSPMGLLRVVTIRKYPKGTSGNESPAQASKAVSNDGASVLHE